MIAQETPLNVIHPSFTLRFFLQSEADRTLIYITLYITECLKKLQKVYSLLKNMFGLFLTGLANGQVSLCDGAALSSSAASVTVLPVIVEATEFICGIYIARLLPLMGGA